MEDRSRREVVRLVVAGVLLLVLVALIAANSDSVKVSLIVTERRMPLIVLLGITALLSALATLVVSRRRKS